MSSPETIAFFKLIYQSNRSRMSGSRVLEVGSHDVYGALRLCFPTVAAYIGIDLTRGKSVDFVMSSHDLGNDSSPLNFNSFDVVISGSQLEHDSDWRLSVKNMMKMLKPGGLLLIMCATRGYPEHGTFRTDPTASPGTSGLGLDHYANVDIEDFMLLMSELEVVDLRVWHNPKLFELFALASRAPVGFEKGWIAPTDGQMKQIFNDTPMRYQVARWPIRFIMKLMGVKSSEFFGRYYWKYLSKLFWNFVRKS